MYTVRQAWRWCPGGRGEDLCNGRIGKGEDGHRDAIPGQDDLTQTRVGFSLQGDGDRVEIRQHRTVNRRDHGRSGCQADLRVGGVVCRGCILRGGAGIGAGCIFRRQCLSRGAGFGC